MPIDWHKVLTIAPLFFTLSKDHSLIQSILFNKLYGRLQPFDNQWLTNQFKRDVYRG